MERQPIQRVELSEQYLTDLAYFNFIRLAQVYGKTPGVENDEPEESKAFKQNQKVLAINIPANLSSGRLYFLSGKDYGTDSNTVEINYDKGDMSTKLVLVKGKKTGNVHVVWSRFLHLDRESNISTPISNRKVKVNMLEVNDILKNAEMVLERQERERIIAQETARRNARKNPFKQRLYDGMVSLAQMLPPSV